MLLAKIVAGMNLGFVPSKDLLQLLDEVLQVWARKFPAEPKNQSWYRAHGGESLGNLAGSRQGDFAKRDSTAFWCPRSSPIPQSGSPLQPCKTQRSIAQNRGESRIAGFPQQFNELSA
jgi:hypothetical protein